MMGSFAGELCVLGGAEEASCGRKTKWCRNAGQRERELQDWGMGHFVEKMSGFVSKGTASDDVLKSAPSTLFYWVRYASKD